MRRTAVFLLLLGGALAEPAAGSAAAAPRHKGSRTEVSAAREDPCGGLGRADRRACQADFSKDAAAGRAREARAKGADPCARLARGKRDACEREVDAAELAAARSAPVPADRGRRRTAAAAAPEAKSTSPRPAAAARRELQPADLVGGVEAEAAAPAGKAAPALRGSLSADVAVPVAAAPARAGRGAARRPARLHEVVLEDGQSLADLAASSGMSVEDLARLNGVSSADDVPTGFKLKVPGAAPATALASVRTPPPVAPPVTASAAAPPAEAVRTPREERRTTASAAPTNGPRPYSSLGPVGSGPAPSAPARGRWGRTADDAMAAYAVASARAPRLADRPAATHDRFVWPVRSEVVSAYGDHGAGRRNDGLDLAARPGDPVRAAAAGEVVYAGKEIATAGGNLVLLKHADGWVTAYSHLGRLTVAMRQTVEQGQEIAETPDAAGAAVHFEVRQPGAGGAKPVDPATVLPSRAASGETGRG